MFYLMDKKDGLHEGSILINTASLKSLEVTTGKGNYCICFNFKGEEQLFSFKPQDLPDIADVIDYISQNPEPEYFNHFIKVTDSENVKGISNRFGKNSDILTKASFILININEIGLVYQNEEGYILTTDTKNYHISESPKEVFDMIQSKMIKNDFTNPIESALGSKISFSKRL